MANNWRYSTYSIIDSKVKEIFPFEKPRKDQLETISEIKNAIDNGYKYIVLEAGTGTGKSVMAATLALMYDTTYILTITKQLQDQYRKDFKDLGFKVVKGRGNFKCKKYAQDGVNLRCDEGRCVIEGYRCEYSIKRKSEEDIDKSNTCGYEYQKWVALNSDVVISNYHYMFLELNYNQDFNNRKLLVCDEAHNLEDTVMSQLKLEFNRKELKEYGINFSKETVTHLNNGNYNDWIEFIHRIKDNYQKEYDKIKDLKKEGLGEKISFLKRRIEDCNRFIKHIHQDPTKWIFDYDSFYGICEFKPIQIDGYAKDTLFKYADVCLFMSATILDYKLFAKWLGIKENEIYAIRRKSPFDVARNPIKTFDGCNMTYSNLSQSAHDSLPIVKEILDIHKNDKGIIHTVSHQCKNYLKKNLNNDRLIDHKTFNRSSQLKKFKKSKKPLVLISPSMNEGVDLPGSQCRFQIMYKIPYPTLADKQTNLRKNIDQQWYDYKTALSLVQTYGRGMRFEQDYCKTYFIDSRLKGFIRRDEATNNFLPDSFKDAIDIVPAEIDESEVAPYEAKLKKELLLSETDEDDDYDEKSIDIEIPEMDSNLSYDDKINFKFSLVKKGDKLIKDKHINSAIDYYNKLLTHELFVNDYHPYRKLSRVYRKAKRYEDEVNIIVKFFKSGIYCSDKQLDWFKKRLKQLSKYDNFDYSQIDELEDEFYRNGFKNRDLASVPVPIAIEIKKSKKAKKRKKPINNTKYDESYFNSLANEIAHESDYIDEKEFIKIHEDDYIDFDNFEEVRQKADWINKGKQLEKENPEDAVDFYEDLKSNGLFNNDYYPYRRQCILLKNRIKDNQRDWDVIFDFFSKEIYCNDHQLIWFKNKIKELSKKLNLTDSEIDEINVLVEKFEKNKEKYHEKLLKDTVPIAERIYETDENGLRVISQEKYDSNQELYYIKELGVGYIRRKEYEAAIKYHINLLGSNVSFQKYHAYKQFARIFREMKDPEEFERIYDKNLN